MSGKKLLLVEDNLLLCGILKKWLLKAGYDVVTATDEPSARRLRNKKTTPDKTIGLPGASAAGGVFLQGLTDGFQGLLILLPA